MKNFLFALITLSAFANLASAQTYYFTRGLPASGDGAQAWTRNFSDLTNWSKSYYGGWDNSDTGWNTDPADLSSAPSGIGVNLKFNSYSGYNGADKLSGINRAMNIDADNVVLGSIEFSDTQDSIQRIYGNKITFQTTSAEGNIFWKSRRYNNNYIDNDIDLVAVKNTSDQDHMAYNIVWSAALNGTDKYERNLIFNGKITSLLNPSNADGTWDNLTVRMHAEYDVAPDAYLGKTVFNNIVDLKGRCLQVTSESISTGRTKRTKVVLGGTGDNNLTLKAAGYSIVELAKEYSTDLGRNYYAANRIEMNANSTVRLMAANQTSKTAVLAFFNPKFKTVENNPFSGTTVAGTLELNGFDYECGDVIFYNNWNSDGDSAVVGVIDFGAGSRNDIAFIFNKAYASAAEKFVLDGSGLRIKNFRQGDLIFIKDVNGDKFKFNGVNYDLIDLVEFDGLGEKNVDYWVTIEKIDPTTDGFNWMLGYTTVPEPSTTAAIFAITAFLMFLKRRK